MLLRIINLNASWKLSSWAPLCRTECRPSRVWLSVSHKSKFPLQPEEGRKKERKVEPLQTFIFCRRQNLLDLLHTQSFSCIIQISTKMRLGRRDHAAISTFSWFLRFMGKEQQNTTGAASLETEKNRSKLISVFWSHVNVSDCVTSSCHAITSVGYENVSHHSLKTHETQFKPDW